MEWTEDRWRSRIKGRFGIEREDGVVVEWFEDYKFVPKGIDATGYGAVVVEGRRKNLES